MALDGTDTSVDGTGTNPGACTGGTCANGPSIGPGPCADGPGPCTDGPGACADGPGTCADGPGICVDGPGTCADGPGICVDGPGIDSRGGIGVSSMTGVPERERGSSPDQIPYCCSCGITICW